ncbi:hypothetical protein BpHYR1_024235 [Brachionus plicatilis]|uniref:RNA-directed DNA polymerase from mobile element jockey-like n=1 Tax=Brachionus plicatilis TaxID=10195 RepID=A0A3M7R9G8_BRAPC|nr:hypothetical protein BpHYR1_024235 [Brachionus plicatilis]
MYFKYYARFGDDRKKLNKIFSLINLHGFCRLPQYVKQKLFHFISFTEQAWQNRKNKNLKIKNLKKFSLRKIFSQVFGFVKFSTKEQNKFKINSVNAEWCNIQSCINCKSLILNDLKKKKKKKRLSVKFHND